MDALLFILRTIVQWILGRRRVLQVVRVARNDRRNHEVCDCRDLEIRDGEIRISTLSGPPGHSLRRNAPQWDSPPTGRQFPWE